MKKIKINQFNIHQYISNSMNIYILLILIIKIQTITFFNAIPTINNQYYFITEDKIIYHNNNNNTYDTKFEFDSNQMIQSDEEYETISYGRFNQELESQGNLLIIKGYIYSLTDTGSVSFLREISGMSKELSNLIPIKIIDQESYFILATINPYKHLILILYKGKDYTIKYSQFDKIYINSKSVSCHYKTNLICFYENNSNEIVSSIFNVSIISQTNGEIKYISSYSKDNGGAGTIKSFYSSNLNKYLVCFIKNNNTCGCMIYDSNKNKWGYPTNYLTKCINKLYSLNLQYFDGFNFYILSCFQAEKQFSFIKLNNNFEILDKEENNTYCLNKNLIKDCSSFSLGSLVNDIKRNDPAKIYGICNSEIKKYEFKNVSIPTTFLETSIIKIPATIPITILPTTIKKITTTIPTTILTTTIDKVPSTNPIIISTTINKVPSTNPIIISTTINKVPSTIPNIISTTIKNINTTIKIYITTLKSNQYKTSNILIQTDKLTTISNAYEDIDSFYLLFENNKMPNDNILDNLRYELRIGKFNKLLDNIIIKDKKSIIYRDNNLTYELISTDIKNIEIKNK